MSPRDGSEQLPADAPAGGLSRIRDYGEGNCEVEGCGHPRHYFAATRHYAPVCSMHAWTRITKALALGRPKETP